MPGRVRGLHVLVVEVPGLDDVVPALQRGRHLASAPAPVADLRPVLRVVVRRIIVSALRARIDCDHPVILLVVCDLVPDGVDLDVSVRLPLLVRYALQRRNLAVQRDVRLSAADFPVADRPQRDLPDILPRHRAAQNHAVIDGNQRVIRHGHIHVIPAVVLVGDRRLLSCQRDAVLAEIRCTLRVQFNHLTIHLPKEREGDLKALASVTDI